MPTCHASGLVLLTRLWGVMLVLAFGATASVAQTREVRVGVYQNEPKIFSGTDGKPSGIFGDLLQAIAREHNWTLQAVPCKWQACLDALQAGEIDLMPDVARNEQRAKIFDFHTTPALLSWSQIYKHPQAGISSALDLKGKRIAVLDGSIQQDYLESLLSGFRVQAEIVPVRSLDDAFEAVAARRVDAAVANRFFGDLQAPRYALEATPILFQPAELFFATTRGRNGDLIKAIETQLLQWQANPGSYYFDVLQHWMNAAPRDKIPRAVWWGISGLGLLLAVALLLAVRLRRQVDSKAWDLQSTEDRLAAILNGVDAYIYIKDTELRYQYANQKVCDHFKLPSEQVLGRSDSDFFDEATATRLRINDLRVIEHGERVEEEESNLTADGQRANTFLSIKLPLRNRDDTIYALCGISTDITRHKESEEAIHQLAFYDPLTLLPNRRLLMERLHQALAAQIRDKECGALLFIDVDNFKDLNDTLGHDMGDTLLRLIAQRLQDNTRAQDTLARQGGDEFVVMLLGLSPDLDDAVQQASQAGSKILEALALPYDLGGKQYQSSVSVGVAMFSQEPVSQNELLKQADLAMYQAKADGRNTMRFFNPQMQAQVSERTALEADLHRALAHNEFLLYYQPQINSDGIQIGVEALVRWKHPQRGLVAPAQFIPAAESSGLILPLGNWILQAACQQLLTWASQPNKTSWCIAVNVSARQFRQADFVQQVQHALQSTGANPNLLELELTESQLVDNVETVIAKMDALKAMGVRLSLDDFGTGYSSLSMLKRLPLDQLKIDQSFVRDLLTDPQDASIVRAIVTLGKSLELDVIAEGVETEAQRDALLSLGCQQFQGYLFGRPAPP
jgi:diguanylate cyclase (GGDEF)-like protein/PAS domain S-box-containing protein